MSGIAARHCASLVGRRLLGVRITSIQSLHTSAKPSESDAKRTPLSKKKPLFISERTVSKSKYRSQAEPTVGATREESDNFLESVVYTTNDGRNETPKRLGAFESPRSGIRSSKLSTAKPAYSEKQSATKARHTRNVLYDPYLVAARVQKHLEKDDIDTAVRAAMDAGVESVVSWNYIINHEMEKHRVSAAFGHFNVMRKRRVVPNERTFTILLTGLANNAATVTSAAERCLNLFAYISQQDKIPINVFHLNAALTVCRACKSPDTMWQILELAGEKRWLKLDAASYTAILYVLRDVSSSDTPQIFEDAKTVWKEAVAAHRAGKIQLTSLSASVFAQCLMKSGDPENIYTALQVILNATELPVFVERSSVPGVEKLSDESTDDYLCSPKHGSLDIRDCALIWDACFRLQQIKPMVKYLTLFREKVGRKKLQPLMRKYRYQIHGHKAESKKASSQENVVSDNHYNETVAHRKTRGPARHSTNTKGRGLRGGRRPEEHVAINKLDRRSNTGVQH